MAATEDFSSAFADIETYDRLLGRYADVALTDAAVLEVGYGARPYRLLALLSMGVDAEGVDAEAPILHGAPREFAAMYRVNGTERLIKSLVRHTLFDRRERRQFTAALDSRGLALRLDTRRFHIGDAAAFQPPRPYDLIFSEDVFEHIPPGSLEVLVPKMARWLRPGGLAVITPNVFTGITGGHALDWSRQSFTTDRRRTVEPWDHLRARRHRANTFLNGLTRQQYRDLFSTAFTILEERVSLPDLGREFLTGRVADELTGFSDEELFSNQVRMVLRPRA